MPTLMRAALAAVMLLSMAGAREEGAGGGVASSADVPPPACAMDEATVACVAADDEGRRVYDLPCAAALFGWRGVGDHDHWLALTPASFMLPKEGCDEPPSPPVAAHDPPFAAVVRRGGCGFAAKALYAQASGASGLVVVNTDEGEPFPMGASDEDQARAAVPAVMVGMAAGEALIGQAGAREVRLRGRCTPRAEGGGGGGDGDSEPGIDVDTIRAVARDLAKSGRVLDAIMQLELALTVEPTHPKLLLEHLWLKQDACDWRAIEAAEATLESALAALAAGSGSGQPSQVGDLCPFLSPALGMPTSLVTRICRARAADLSRFESTAVKLSPAAPSGSGRRLRLGYASEFLGTRHPITYLLSNVAAEHHRQRRVELVACFNTASAEEALANERQVAATEATAEGGGEGGGGGTNAEVEVIGCNRTSLVDGSTHVDVDVDVLIDLDGQTSATMPKALARRQAVVHLHYLGQPQYPLALPNLDYYVSDAIMSPPDQPLFTGGATASAAVDDEIAERLLLLPHFHMFQGQPFRRASEEAREVWRASMGVAPNATLFACFNQAKKIEPAIFESWSMILRRVPGSLLWLPHVSDPQARYALLEEASVRGLQERLVFSDYVDGRAAHLERMAAADMSLDTSRYTAGSVAIEGLLQCIPLITLAGDTVAARQAASAVMGVKMGFLIAHTHKEYEDMAVRLAVMAGPNGSGGSNGGGRTLSRTLCGRCAPHTREATAPAPRPGSCPLASKARVADLEHAAQSAYEAKRALLGPMRGRAALARPSHVVVTRAS